MHHAETTVGNTTTLATLVRDEMNTRNTRTKRIRARSYETT